MCTFDERHDPLFNLLHAAVMLKVSVWSYLCTRSSYQRPSDYLILSLGSVWLYCCPLGVSEISFHALYHFGYSSNNTWEHFFPVSNKWYKLNIIVQHKGYIYLVPAIPNLKIPIDAGLVDVADNCHIRHAIFRARAWKVKWHLHRKLI